jgi:membrane protein involved in colicin uptake
MGMMGVGQVLKGTVGGGKFPEGAMIMLKNGDDEILLTGEEYTKFRNVVKEEGTDYSSILDLMEEGRAKALAAKQKREVEKQKSSKEGKQRKAEDEKRKEEEQAKRAEERGVRDERLARLARMEDAEARAIIAENLRKERDKKAAADLAAAQRVAAARAQDSYRQQDDDDGGSSSSATEYSVDTGFEDRTDFGGGSGPFAKGGLASKPKPKPKKKMKRGGLASKK